MMRKLRHQSVVSFLGLLLGILIAMGSQARAQVVKPFKVKGAGIVEYVPLVPLVPVSHWAVGEGTGLGRYHGEGQVQLLGFTGPTTADFDSAVPFVFIAANGDQLVFTYGDVNNHAARPGEVTLSPSHCGLFVATWVAEFNPVPALCTGRFAKVTGGSFTMVAVTAPFVLGGFDPVPYHWSGHGTLTYAR